jgi:hypothetical protein
MNRHSTKLSELRIRAGNLHVGLGSRSFELNEEWNNSKRKYSGHQSDGHHSAECGHVAILLQGD